MLLLCWPRVFKDIKYNYLRTRVAPWHEMGGEVSCIGTPSTASKLHRRKLELEQGVHRIW